MRRALLVAYYYPPVGGGGVQRLVKFVRYLGEFGYQPVVLTGPGGGTDWWAPEDDSLGEEVAGAEVYRVPGPEPQNPSGWRRRAHRLLDLELPSVRWWQNGVLRLGRTLAPTVDVILGELVPYFTGEAVERVARESGTPWVADLQDPWALDEMWLYPSGLHRYRDLRRMRRVLGAAGAVVMNTPEAVLRVERRFPELRERLTEAIPNGLDASDFPTTQPPATNGAFRIVHAGYLHTDAGLKHRKMKRLRELAGGTPVRGVDFLPRSHVFLLEAVDRLLRRTPELRSTLEIHVAGVASETDRAVAARSPVTKMHGYLSHSETIDLLQTANLLFLPMHDLPPGVRAGLVPGKTYEYLAAGKPILAAVPEGDARDLLTEAGNALICDPTDVTRMAELIAGEIRRAREGRPTPPPRPDVVGRYDRKRQTEQLAAVFDAVLEGRPVNQGSGRTLTSPNVTSA